MWKRTWKRLFRSEGWRVELQSGEGVLIGCSSPPESLSPTSLSRSPMHNNGPPTPFICPLSSLSLSEEVFWPGYCLMFSLSPFYFFRFHIIRKESKMALTYLKWWKNVLLSFMKKKNIFSFIHLIENTLKTNEFFNWICDIIFVNPHVIRFNLIYNYTH